MIDREQHNEDELTRAAKKVVETAADCEFDHHSAEQMTNPYPFYERMRGACPVGRTKQHGGFWVVSRYNDIHAVEMDYSTYSNRDGTAIPQMPSWPMYPDALDPPRQTAFRRVLNPLFTVEAVEVWRPMIEKKIHALIDKVIGQGFADLANDICRPLPPAVVLPLVGVPVEDQDRLCEWTDHLTRGRGDPDAVAVTGEKIAQYLTDLVAKRRAAEPEDDLIGSLLACKIQGTPLSDDEIFRVLIIVLFGGLDTTPSAMLEALLYLSEHPEKKEQLRCDPSLWPTAVEEFIRFASPVQGLRRTVVKATELAGTPISEGDLVFLLYASANRDREVFNDPDRCVLDRAPNPHLAFGAGAHVCLGRNLARLEIDIVLRAILQRIPDFKVIPDAVLEYAVGESRALKSLPVTFSPRSVDAE